MARHLSVVASLALAIGISTLSTLFPAPTWAADGLIVTSDSVGEKGPVLSARDIEDSTALLALFLRRRRNAPQLTD